MARIIEVRDVTKRFTGGGSEPVVALDALTLDMDQSEFLAVMGPSGCGKSTLLNIIAGFMAFPPDRTDQSFRMSVLPRRSRGTWSIPYTHRLKAPDECLAVRTVAVTNEISRCLVPAAGFRQLTRNPFSTGIGGHTQP